ncbi:MAG: hypothetical protein Q9227_000286 [Pyrenula ochraceoflavens]
MRHEAQAEKVGDVGGTFLVRLTANGKASGSPWVSRFSWTRPYASALAGILLLLRPNEGRYGSSEEEEEAYTATASTKPVSKEVVSTAHQQFAPLENFAMMRNYIQYLSIACATGAILTNAAPAGFQLPARQQGTIQGVNLGGWLVLEPWIVPDLFERAGDGIVDEYTLGQTLGHDAAYSLLSSHWDSWITADDFGQIAAAGLNTVRIPIGFWAVNDLANGTPYVAGAIDYMDKAIGWARGSGLKVIIDLHGAPGSQNGFDNSGRYGPIEFQTGDTVDNTLKALSGLASRYSGDTDVVTMFEILNEPLPPTVNLDSLKQFYNDAASTIHDSMPGTTIVFHDAFQGVGYWNGFSPAPSSIVDTHIYQVFNLDQLQESIDDHVGDACSNIGSLSGADKGAIVGEWTGALTDCAKYLNGRYKGSRYDGTFDGNSGVGSCDGLSSGSVDALSGDQKTNIRRFNEAQLDAYSVKSGWVFWTWKTEGAPEWDLQAQLVGGLFPKPLTDRQHPNQCSQGISSRL